MNLGGPVWHASANATDGTQAVATALAERALTGVGDALAGEWREVGQRGVVHIRRRLTERERIHAGRIEVRDIRDTPEERRRLRRLVAEAPHTKPYVPARLLAK